VTGLSVVVRGVAFEGDVVCSGGGIAEIPLITTDLAAVCVVVGIVEEIGLKRMSGVGPLGYLSWGETGRRWLVLRVGMISQQRDGRLLQELRVGAVHMRAHVGGELADRSAALLRNASPLR